jgi:hypothetical protein
MATTWDDMIAEFRALGGTADNIRLGMGAIGRGIFPIDPALPIKIDVPENLLVPVADLEFDGAGDIRLKSDSKIGAREKAFFEAFERDFSFGDGGYRDCEAFLGEMDALADELKKLLAGDFGLGHLFRGEGVQRIRQRFLHSRMITHEKGDVLMPVLELVNHGVGGFPFAIAKSISIGGHVTGEVYAHYGLVDSHLTFGSWGFASEEPAAFSLPLTMPLPSRRLLVMRQLNNRKVRGQFRVPTVTVEDGKLTIAYVMLGHARYPRLAKGTFYKLLEEAGEAGAEEVFDRVKRFNIQRFLYLLGVLDGQAGRIPATLRAVCRYQIGAMANSVGTREV